jgi:hypothetical protein
MPFANKDRHQEKGFSMKFLDKYIDYWPLLTIYWFLITPLGGATRIHNPNYFILYLVTIPVWVCLIMATLKIKKARKRS